MKKIKPPKYTLEAKEKITSGLKKLAAEVGIFPKPNKDKEELILEILYEVDCLVKKNPLCAFSEEFTIWYSSIPYRYFELMEKKYFTMSTKQLEEMIIGSPIIGKELSMEIKKKDSLVEKYNEWKDHMVEEYQQKEFEDKDIYFGDFSDFEDLYMNFKITPETLDEGAVLFAIYTNEDYSGKAFVLVCDALGNMYEINASHCSCYGLEGQWQPESITEEELTFRIKEGTSFNDYPLEALNKLKKLSNYNYYESKPGPKEVYVKKVANKQVSDLVKPMIIEEKSIVIKRKITF